MELLVSLDGPCFSRRSSDEEYVTGAPISLRAFSALPPTIMMCQASQPGPSTGMGSSPISPPCHELDCRVRPITAVIIGVPVPVSGYAWLCLAMPVALSTTWEE